MADPDRPAERFADAAGAADLHTDSVHVRHVLDSLFAFVGVLAVDGTLLEANRAPLEAAGITFADVAGRPFWQCYWWNHDAAVQARIREACGAAARGESVRFDVEACMAGGRLMPIDFMLSPLRDGGEAITHLVASAVDITERKATEVALRESEARFRGTFENAAVGIAHVGLDGSWLGVNDRLCQLVGYTREELLARTFQDITHPDDLDADLDLFETLLQGERRSYRMEKRYFHREGRVVWIDLTVALQRDEKGRPRYAISVIVDITRQKAAEHEVRRRERELRELNRTLERRVAERTADLEARNEELQSFAYIASHDLREPLRKMRAFATLLPEEEDTTLGEQGRFIVERIASAAERMDGLLTDLLTFSRVATHTTPFREVELGDMIDDVLQDYELVLRETGARVEVEADVTVEADARQLRQLLTNLVGNALKYRREDVTPHLRVEAHIVEREGGAPLCRLTVTDNGIGFDEKYGERIFEPFQRLHGRSVYEGTGMGLAICRRIARRHGGELRAESTPGAGSRFMLELPVVQA